MTKAELQKEIAAVQQKCNARQQEILSRDPAWMNMQGQLSRLTQWLESLGGDGDGDAKPPISKNGKAPKKVPAPPEPDLVPQE